jgi:endonuclease YncB( thermonuclease family)
VTGRVRVRDGDTIEVGGIAVRLQGLHCPELREAGGRAASSAMQRLTRGNEVRCTLTGERTYDRIVGTCHVGASDLAAALIRERVCARCPRYDTAGRYAAAQRDAGAWNRSMPGYCR